MFSAVVGSGRASLWHTSPHEALFRQSDDVTNYSFFPEVNHAKLAFSHYEKCSLAWACIELVIIDGWECQQQRGQGEEWHCAPKPIVKCM